MQIIMNSENKESIYELIYDEESIRSLISEIIKNCSIRKQCKCFVEATSHVKAVIKIDSATNWNGDKIHENVHDINEEPINDPFDYWRHGDPVPFSFKSNVLISPKLVDFLINVISNENIDYEWFSNRKELSERNNIQTEIQRLDSEINQISNFETKRKIDKLKELSKMVNDFNDIPEFDYELLSKYYDIAQNCIQLELIQETVKFQKKLTPKKYSTTKQD